MNYKVLYDILVALCDGHGIDTAGKRTPYIKSLGRSIKENEFNRAVVKFLDIELRRCGFKTLLVAPTDADTSLTARTKLAISKGAKAYISIHYDAFDGKFDGDAKDPSGHSIFVYPGATSSKKLANLIYGELRNGTTQKSRGVKEANFQVLRDTYKYMPAILSENGFMDNEREALLMVNEAFQKEVAIEHAKGICKYFGKPYVSNTQAAPPSNKVDSPQSKETYYRVVVGSFIDQKSAEAQRKKIEGRGLGAFLAAYHKGNVTYYRVVAGSFKNRSEADQRLKYVKQLGYDAFIDVFTK